MNGVVPAPGTLRLYPAEPNPNGAEGNRLFLFKGDATTEPIHNVELAPGGTSFPTPGRLYSQDFALRIFHFNDLHGHLMDFKQDGERAILSRLAWKIQSARQACLGKSDEAVLVFSAGDDCSGSIFDEIIMDTSQDYPNHPGYLLYSKMGVDVAGLGNHDLDRGISFLADVIRHNARFPVLAANLSSCSQISDFCYPAALLELNGLRVGIIGLVTRAETHLNPDISQIVHPIPVAQNLVSAVRPLCDVMIIISHLGHKLTSPVPMADAGDVELAQSLPPHSVDLIIGGHSHTALNADGLCEKNIINGIPIVQSGAHGEYLGQVELKIQKKTVSVIDAHLINVSGLPFDQDFEENEMQPFIHQVRQLWEQPLGIVDHLPDLSTQAVVNDFSKRELALANFVSDALVERLRQRGFHVDFGMIDSSTLQCGLPFSENLTYGVLFEAMPYADTLRLYRLTGQQVKDLVADNVLRIDRVGDPDLERGFLQFSQDVKYKVNLGRKREDAKPVDILIKNEPLRTLEEKEFLIATSSFARERSVPWEETWNRSRDASLLDLHKYPSIETDFMIRQEIATYIQDHGGVTRASGARCDGRLIVKSAED